jgi:hybrid polyketide synthase/nonribosomal peptide synthetase ACE1
VLDLVAERYTNFIICFNPIPFNREPRELRNMTRATLPSPEPIAIVGSGLRFPGGANSSSSLWSLLKNPHDLRQEITPDRFNPTGLYHHDGARHGSTNVRHSYLLDQDIRVFDAAFFNISANEAEAIDPQQRLLLETVYEALEAGGHTLEALRGSDTSVYVGTMSKWVCIIYLPH